MFCLIQSLVAVQLSDNLSIGGHYLGVFNTFNTYGAQFDFATNIDLDFRINDDMRAFVQFQGGNGGGTLGYVGPELAVTDLSIIYTPRLSNAEFTLGSFDTPYGYETGFLTNNADATSSVFILNHLTYAALAGSVGTLNTLGVKLEKPFVGNIDLVASLSNGTAETAENSGHEFSTVVQLSQHSILDSIRLTATYMSSNDKNDSQSVSPTSFLADFSASLYEVMYTPSSLFNIMIHTGTMTFGDDIASTKDLVTNHMIGVYGARKALSWGARLSQWQPDGDDSSSISALVAQPGLQASADNALSIDRLQVTLGYQYSDQVTFKIEYINDNYSSGDDISGVVSAVNVSF